MINEDQLYLIIRMQLKSIREGQGLSQAQVAQQLDLERTSITNIEGGRQRPNIHMLYRFCEVMGLGLDDIFPAIRDVTDSPEERTLTIGDTKHKVSKKIASVIERQIKKSP